MASSYTDQITPMTSRISIANRTQSPADSYSSTLMVFTEWLTWIFPPSLNWKYTMMFPKYPSSALYTTSCAVTMSVLTSSIISPYVITSIHFFASAALRLMSMKKGKPSVYPGMLLCLNPYGESLGLKSSRQYGAWFPLVLLSSLYDAKTPFSGFSKSLQLYTLVMVS